MLEKIKIQIEKKMTKSEEDKSMQKLYDKEVNLFLNAVLEADSIDQLAIKIKVKKIDDLLARSDFRQATPYIEDLLANKDLLLEKDFYKILVGRAIILINSGCYNEALELLSDLEKVDNRLYKCQAKLLTGVAYIYITRNTGKKHLDEAEELLIQAQDLLNPEEKKGNFQVLVNMALIYFERSKFDKALDYYKEALEWATCEKDKGEVYTDMARIFILKSKMEIAKDYLDMAERIFVKMSNYTEVMLAWNLYVRGLWYKKDGKFFNAINCLEMALTTFIEKEFFCEAADVSYQLYAINNFIDNDKAEEYLSDYKYYSQLIS